MSRPGIVQFMQPGLPFIWENRVGGSDTGSQTVGSSYNIAPERRQVVDLIGWHTACNKLLGWM